MVPIETQKSAGTTAGTAAGTTADVPTEVADVLASLEQLDELPVQGHVAVFEQAHDALRRVLDAARADFAGDSPVG